MQTLCRLKPGKQSEIANEKNFNFRFCTEILLKQEELKAHKIIPELKRPASVHFVLDIDWDN